jgi:hypothetical protein
MHFHRHFHENPPASVRKLLKRLGTVDHKTAVWNTFADSDLTGVNDDDCAILPRILPASYLSEIRRTVKEITTFAMRLLSLPENEIRAIVPHGPIRDFLIDELEILRFRSGRITGSFRFDMAVVGEPKRGNPPKLLETNEIGFDGLARSSYIQKSILSLVPELRKKVIALDTAKAEVRNMLRLGRNISRIQYDTYNWDEEYLLKTATAMGVSIELISPIQFGYEIDDDCPLLQKKKVSVSNRRVRIGGDGWPDAIQLSFAFELEDYKRGRRLYRDLVRSKTPQYGPFLTGLVAAKMILVLLNDKALRKKLLGSSRTLENAILPAYPIEECFEETSRNANNSVIKHTDGFGGQQVFVGSEIIRQLHKIKKHSRSEWVSQERTYLNTITVNGILSRPKRVISDLGVFVQYDWSSNSFKNFEIGGFITRATNRSLKVNVSGGGIQVPVMFLRGQ